MSSNNNSNESNGKISNGNSGITRKNSSTNLGGTTPIVVLEALPTEQINLIKNNLRNSVGENTSIESNFNSAIIAADVKEMSTTRTPIKSTINDPSIIIEKNISISPNHNTTTSRSHLYPNSHNPSTFSLNKNEEFQWIRPPECPVFRPNDDEFKNPLAYISKIRPFAEKYGIAKIQPPKSWTPPFAVDVDKLNFTPRVQRLNELEAKTRVKLNFLDQIAKFWELQGSSLKIPMVERKALDLYSLHRIVQEEGGMEIITRERKWSKVAAKMNYPPGKSVGTILKGHYERILHPFDIFTSGKAIDVKLETESEYQDYKPHGIESRQQITPPNETTARRSKRFTNNTPVKYDAASGSNSSPPNCPTSGNGSPITSTVKQEEEISVEYTKRTNYGKMASGGRMRSRMACVASAMKKKSKDLDPLAKYICHICNRGDAEETMLLCDGCDDSYHTFCLMPPLNDIPKGDWRCPKCVVEEVSKPTEAFGFEQAQREYTLQEFGEMADQFKADYFNMAVHLVPTDLVEREFWRIVSSIDEDVTVEYGADLHTMDHGSGFPTKSSLYLLPGDEEYAESPWNLNNLPVLEESILGHINADISGMKVPWMYVGMCFATFCWHNEDHWSYSINYLHWGEPKTWYGVPGSKAETFEETMKSAAPELFQSQPDLLHQLVTIMNPNILMNHGVPVYRTDQQAGEFVITFPRAYHAGFNQGYNFAEAVNFAPADWMKMGRECVNHYSMLRRFCVFSHDELVCKMAVDPDKLNLGIATACYLDMAEMVDSEKKLRKSLLEWGVTKAEREAFELVQDDERQCDACKTTCFLSAVTCSCTKALVCLRHYTELCDCLPEKHTLKYRYTLDELPLMLKRLKVKAESFENWLSKVRDVLDPTTPTTITLEELQNLSNEAETKKFPSSVLLERLNSAVLEAEKCVTVIQQLDINKMRTRTRNDSAKYKLSMDELDMFVQEIENLCCIISEGQSVRELKKLGHQFVAAVNKILQQKLTKCSERELEVLIEEGQSLCIELQEIKLLKSRLQQVNWYRRVREFRDNEEKIPLADVHKFLKEGHSITPDSILEKELTELFEIKLTVEDWEEVAKKCFESGTQHELPEIEVLLERAEDIEGELPSEVALRDAVRKAKEWLRTVEVLQSNENYPYFHTLEAIVQRGRNIPFQMEELKRMEEHLENARAWKEQTAKTFLRKQSDLNLMDVLAPRCAAVMFDMRAIKRKPLEEQFTEEMGPVQMVTTFKLAEEKEISDMRRHRVRNMEKSPAEDKYCICRRKFSGLMYQCQLCRDWFHARCVPPPKQTVRPHPQNGNGVSSSTMQVPPQLTLRDKDREIKYLCPSCMRSRRPRLETILTLLVSLQRVPIRLPEGEALKWLTERAMNWQDRVRHAMALDEVKIALDILTEISQKNTGNGSTTIPVAKNKSTTNNKIKKSSSNTIVNNIKNKNSDQDDDDDASSSNDETQHSSAEMKTTSQDDDSEDGVAASTPMKIEHAYSALNPTTPLEPQTPQQPTQQQQQQPSQLQHLPKKSASGITSPLLQSDMPLIQLSQNAREVFDELMMEGDLLELSLDETLHIWRLINASKPSISDLAYIHHRYNISSTSTDVLVNLTESNVGNCQAKKRRSNDLRTPKIPMKKSIKTLNSTLPATQKLKRGRKIKLLNKNLNETDKVTMATNVSAQDSTEQIISTSESTVISTSTVTQTIDSGTTVTTTISTAATVAAKKRKRANATGSSARKSGGIAAAVAAQQEQLHLLATAASTSDDDEECSAPNCARPSGVEVDWVQCDGGCNKWFHMFCVGLDKNQIKSDDDYICKRCCKKISNNSNIKTYNKLDGGIKSNIVNDELTSTNSYVLDENKMLSSGGSGDINNLSSNSRLNKISNRESSNKSPNIS